ncbi:MAG TPA: class I SAM-dependent methyltransferase [Candidatus Nanoarchaeia archaeon]|nr:class I SAM-dependent methyltransferase [Candidatus Nanoarchaeia archaeon]
MTTDNFKKHTSTKVLQRFLINRFFNTLLGELALIKPATILDVGCGEGFTLERLRKAGIGEKTIGVDFLERAIKIGKEVHPHLDLRQGNVYHLDFPDNSFDYVLCLEVLEHLEHPEKALAELRRVAKMGCIISVPREPLFRLANFVRGKNLSRWGNDIEHIQHWSSTAIARLVSGYFKVNQIRKPFPWTIIVGKKYE